MFDGEYSKRVWIISIIMAIGCIVMDIFIMLGDDGIMKDTVWMTLPFSAYILYKCVLGLKKKIEDEKTASNCVPRASAPGKNRRKIKKMLLTFGCLFAKIDKPH